MKLLVCGSRNWTDYEFVYSSLAQLCLHNEKETHLIHGDAIGVDRMAALVAKERGFASIRAFPAEWKLHGRAAGPIRNREMLDEKPDLVVAITDNLESSPGTRDTVEEARRRGISILVFGHDLRWSIPGTPLMGEKVGVREPTDVLRFVRDGCRASNSGKGVRCDAD